jgi:hypothetical protein
MSLLGIIASGISGNLAPSSPVAGYTLWLDAADTSTITEASGAVSQWTDKSASAYVFTQATAAYKPQTNAATQNGKNVMTFDGGDSLKSTAAASTWTFIHSTNSTIFVAYAYSTLDYGVVLCTNTGTSNAIGFGWQGNSPYNPQWAVTGGGGPTNFIASNNAGNNAIDANFTYLTQISQPANGTAANRSDWRIKQGSAIKNNTFNITPSTSAPAESLRIGDFDAGGNYGLGGKLGEILVYNSVLSAGDILLNQQYLAGKWGV